MSAKLAHPLSYNKESDLFTGFIQDQENGWEVCVRFRVSSGGLMIDGVVLTSLHNRHGDTTIVARNR